MHSLETIKRLSREAGENAAENNLEPLIAICNGSIECKQVPDLGDCRPDGWDLVDTLFVDASGFGSKNEAALTINQFMQKVKKDYGYAIIETGQFQLYIGVFKRV